MQQQISLITLGVADLGVSNRFYQEGFGWTPGFTAPKIVFYQMNGFILGTYSVDDLAEDMGFEDSEGGGRGVFQRPAACSLAHNVRTPEEVAPVMEALVAAGGRILRPADAPPHGGLRGYVADPDDHAWEIAYHPMIAIAEDGRVSLPG